MSLFTMSTGNVETDLPGIGKIYIYVFIFWSQCHKICPSAPQSSDQKIKKASSEENSNGEHNFN